MVSLIALEESSDLAKIGWSASLDLLFESRRNKTVLRRNRHMGPLRVQRAFYPADDNRCHVYLLHPPGGVVGGDCLNTNVRVESGANVLITTPGANKIYRSDRAHSRISSLLSIGPHASLEWFPQETIYFSGSRSRTVTEINLDKDAHGVTWDLLCLGRPVSGEKFSEGNFIQRTIFYRNGRPILNDASAATGGDVMLDAIWGWQEQDVFATFYSTRIEKLDSDWAPALGSLVLTRVEGIFIARYLGRSVQEAKSIFYDLWCIHRSLAGEAKPVAPRIWNT
ncbi:MAG: urease accessory protein UreD [Gammaproteobacteria bacterium]|nr:urease accessory protein UreD [Gammaproteobacteria bacterium]MDH5694414.1 urease accessory protein UreD [Gammaproteobacteria bacterium]